MEERFICFRFFIVPVEQHLFAQPADDEQKLRWFRAGLLVNRDYRTKTGAEYALRVSEGDEFEVTGKLSRRHIVEVRDKADDDIREREVEDWPYAEFLVNFPEQLFVVRDNTTGLGEPMSVARVLTAMANEVMFMRGFATSFEPLVRPNVFWNAVEHSEGVYAVKFKLKSPNLFGAASSANEALRSLREEFNNTEADLTLKNPLGKLQLPHAAIDTYREYADLGGGSWSLTVKRGGKRRRVNSEDQALRVTIDVPDGMDTFGLLREVLRRFLDAA